MAMAMGTEYTELEGDWSRPFLEADRRCNHDRRKTNFHMSHWCLDCLLVQLVTGISGGTSYSA